MKRLWIVIAALTLMVASCAAEEPAATEAPVAVTTAAPTTETTAAPTTTDPAPTTTAAAVSMDDHFPVTVTSAAGETTIEERPERIAALSATHVEMLFAVGAGEQVIAGDLFANYPPEAGGIELLDSFNLNVESLIALDPDLVILSFDPVDAVAALDAVGIPTLLLGTATSIEEAYTQTLTVGDASGHLSEARELVLAMQSDMDAIVDTVGGSAEGLTYYHETDPFSYYTPNSASFIGQLYNLLGMENIADAAPDEFGSGFPQLSPEFIVDANPDLIVLAAGGDEVSTLAERPGWDTMTAVANDNVAVIDTDVASRWGPRIVELLRAIADAAGAVQ
ncbi:MAG: ABC transporter substrate-binding protein [Acidimicrobiia bacterium]|nr:ABC transporter substrate-binding protein [Acidimicrobiia bacterium]